MKTKYLPLFIAAVLLFFCCGCSKNPTPISRTGFYFDTVITITLYDTQQAEALDASEVLNTCFSLCETYEAMLSRTKPGSDIWRINHAGGAPVLVHPETARLLERALQYCEETNGLLDITIAPVSDLWNFSSENLLELQNSTAGINEASDKEAFSSHVPSKALLTSRLAHVDYRNVSVQGNTVTLADPDAALDLGCIAKGYIADQLKNCLQAQGVTSALINLGGNLLTLGAKPDGSPFILGIQKPFDTPGSFVATLPVSNASLVSSGIYERSFEESGILYHHLLNPFTGMPQNNDLLGVTILTECSADADALSTLAFLLGEKDGMAYIEAKPGVEAVFITKDGELHPSSGLSGILQTQ